VAPGIVIFSGPLLPQFAGCLESLKTATSQRAEKRTGIIELLLSITGIGPQGIIHEEYDR
jgi:hypothetical protein